MGIIHLDMRNNRDYKKFEAGYIYHIYNRGTAKIDTFLDEEDYSFFLRRLKENIYPDKFPPPKKSFVVTYARKVLPKDQFELICFCLMPNHYHLLILQKDNLSVSKLMSKICTSYAKYFNKKYERVGGLFQDQFKAVLVKSDQQLRSVIDYIHNNPVRAGFVEDAGLYNYSSYKYDKSAKTMKLNN